MVIVSVIFSIFFLIICVLHHINSRRKWFQLWNEASEKINKIKLIDILRNENRTAQRLEDVLSHWKETDRMRYLDRYERVCGIIRNFKKSVSEINLLDIACGDGYMLLLLSNYTHCFLYGLDISTRRVRLARDRGNFSCVVSDAQQIPFGPNSFDIVVSIETIEHLISPEAMLKEVNRILKNEGILILMTPSLHRIFFSFNPLTSFLTILSLYNPSVLPKYHNLYDPTKEETVIHRAFSIKDISGMLLRNGFEVLRLETLEFPTIVSQFHSKLFKTEQKFWSKAPILRKLGGVFLIICQRKRDVED